MANTYKGVGATNWQASIPTLIEQGQYGGKVRRMYDTYTLAADLASGDIIQMGSPLPEGARLQSCKIKSEALGGSCTIDVGWAASSDAVESAQSTGFFSALPVSSATYADSRGSTYEGTAYWQKVLSSPVQVQIAEHAVSSGATGKKIYIEVDYVID